MATAPPDFSPGALVRARGRDWVVVPSDEEKLLRLRPVDGVDEEGVGLFLPLEQDGVKPTEYPPPDPDRAGDFTGALLLREAVRLTLRSGAGPFRSIGRLSVTPRPYQYVPLIMALRLDPVRLLIADDVGVGKTIEAGMVARELLDRGVVRRIAVLCAPHLCEQWETELREKFNIETAMIQSSRIARLEREVPRADIPIYRYYRHLVVSMDFIKSDRNRGPFLDNAPDLIIVDEAHTAARPGGDRGQAQQQRHALIKELAADPQRHLILVTATPHSGIEESFLSLLGLLNPEFDPPDGRAPRRSRLVPHLVQRRRSDLENWLGDDSRTPFPKREESEHTYTLTTEYRRLFDDVLEYCRESVSVDGLRKNQQRVRYWAATAILRCVLSSPAAAAAMLERRAEKESGEQTREAEYSEEAFAELVLDSADTDEPSDYAPRAPLDDPEAGLDRTQFRRLDGFLKRALSLSGPALDAKIAKGAEVVAEFLAAGLRPIVYCRFIATAEYVARQLEPLLKRRFSDLRVVSVSGGDGNSEQRTEIVDDLVKSPMRVLVATDCLSEGINLQEHFDAVIHYDLPWNPNRLEQRAGRVDRYGQRTETVRTALVWGIDSPMDRVVLRVLIRKAHAIRERLGVSVPVPIASDQVVQAVIEDILLNRHDGGEQLPLEIAGPGVSALHDEWDAVAQREDETRSYFAQEGIQPGDVARELEELEPALGTSRGLQRFVGNALQRFNGTLRENREPGVFGLLPGDLQQQIRLRDPRLTFPMQVAFEGVPPEDVTNLGRNHPVVAALSDAVLSRALSNEDPVLSRCSAIFTPVVQERTGVVVLRLRYLLREKQSQQFAEEIIVAALRRSGEGLEWLDISQEEALKLLNDPQVARNMSPEEKASQVEWALGMLSGPDWHATIITDRVDSLRASHDRLRSLVKGASLRVMPHTPPDIIGCFVLVPSGDN